MVCPSCRLLLSELSRGQQHQATSRIQVVLQAKIAEPSERDQEAAPDDKDNSGNAQP